MSGKSFSDSYAEILPSRAYRFLKSFCVEWPLPRYSDYGRQICQFLFSTTLSFCWYFLWCKEFFWRQQESGECWPTDGMRVAGVPVGIGAWVQALVLKTARDVNADVAKSDAITGELLHVQLLSFCQNTHMAFLVRNTQPSTF